MSRPRIPPRLLAVAVGVLGFVAGALLGGSVALGALVGVAAGAGVALVLRGRATGRRASGRIDPFTLSEPWRRYVSAAQSALRRFDATVRAAQRGPLHDRLRELGAQLEHGLDECWRIARRGDEIDASLARLKVTETRRRLAELEERAGPAPSPEEAATLESLRAQVASADRLRATADDAAARLRLIQARLDQLVATAAEVVAATHDPAVLGTGVSELVTELEALRLAVEETRIPRTAADP
jgi:hypothetical protein